MADLTNGCMWIHCFFVARRRHWNDGNCKETHPRMVLVQIVELLFYLYIYIYQYKLFHLDV